MFGRQSNFGSAMLTMAGYRDYGDLGVTRLTDNTVSAAQAAVDAAYSQVKTSEANIKKLMSSGGGGGGAAGVQYQQQLNKLRSHLKNRKRRLSAARSALKAARKAASVSTSSGSGMTRVNTSTSTSSGSRASLVPSWASNKYLTAQPTPAPSYQLTSPMQAFRRAMPGRRQPMMSLDPSSGSMLTAQMTPEASVSAAAASDELAAGYDDVSVPWYTNPVVIVGALGAAAIGVFAFTRKGKKVKQNRRRNSRRRSHARSRRHGRRR